MTLVPVLPDPPPEPIALPRLLDDAMAAAEFARVLGS